MVTVGTVNSNLVILCNLVDTKKISFILAIQILSRLQAFDIELLYHISHCTKLEINIVSTTCLRIEPKMLN